ncbi:aminotransferase class IV [Chryseobacterium koreense]|uniref:aminotransferase class IV n=1 Tax=Chryseobacterium koreense TaxID=232216 RepID=UPI0026E92065|nr:aminotransferase class IV [Chryseobacterium koreense]
MENYFSSENFQEINRAFLQGDAVKTSFFLRNSRLILAEECYFFLMSSMRKMRMKIPLTCTLEFFQNLFQTEVIGKGVSNGIINFMAYRNRTEMLPSKAEVAFFFEVDKVTDVLSLQREFEMDMIKEINVNTNLLSNIRVHCPENVFAEVYAIENDLDDVILQNPNKRIARSIFGNLLFLSGNTIKIPKLSEGALISPLLESFITFIHSNNLALIELSEMIGFESQKADEILMISDEKGIFPVMKIRNKTFSKDRFSEMIEKWKSSFE